MQKIAWNEKYQLHLLCTISNSIWSWFLVHLCKMMISPVALFSFSKFWFFGLSVGEKSKKMVQNDKKFCLLHSISQEPCIIWLKFMVHICKMIIFSGVFFHFFKFLIFWVHKKGGRKRAKNSPKWQKNSVPCAWYLRNHASYDSFMVEMCKMISPGVSPKWWKFLCVAPYISGFSVFQVHQ